MFIDHSGYVVCDNNIMMRTIGRIAFPLFCLLLAEGASKTSNWKKYAARLFVFAIISEPIADYAFYRSWAFRYYQNVYWTLLLGLLAIRCYKLAEKFRDAKDWGKLFLSVIAFFVCYEVADKAHTDYGAFGVALIVLLYIARTYGENLQKRNIASALVIIGMCLAYGDLEIYGSLAAVPVFFYNEKRGWNHPVVKYGFYIFYPAHLLLLILIRAGVGTIYLG